MLNYISAEWYKLRRTRGIFIAFGLLLCLVTLLFWPAFWYEEPTFYAYTAAYMVGLLLGFFLAPIFAIKAFDDQYGRGTMKNEVVFGIPRRRIYLGKLAFGALAGVVAALLVLGFYLLLCLLSGEMKDENALFCIDLCIRGTLLVLPLWLGSLSLAFCLQAVIKSSAGATVADYLFLFFLTPVALVGSEEPTASLALNFINKCFFVSPYRRFYMVGAIEQVSGMGYSWLVGLGWVAATTLVGLAALSRKEIQ